MTAADPEAVLAAMPSSLRVALLAAARQATDRLGRGALPSGLRPYAGFTPAALGDGAALRAVNRALASDARLREAVGAALSEELWTAAEGAAAEQLIARFGASDAAAALVARARWDDLQRLVAGAGAQPQRAPRRAEPAAAATRSSEVAAARRERAQVQRQAAAAEQRAAQAEAELRAVRRKLADVEARRDRLQGELDTERGRARDRLARLRRRTSDAEARARVQQSRAADLAAQLRAIADRMVESGASEPAAAERADCDVPAPPPASIPRGVAPATAGRPCILPPGVAPDQPAAVHALLAVPGIAVVVDGYNVTKDLRGVPTAPLEQQRAWLQRLAAAVAAPRDVRITLVFDGEGDRTTAAAAARVVRVVYTAAAETADARIVGIVSALAPDAPAMVVTSDAEVRDAVQAQRANVVASGVFLSAVG